MFSGANDLDLPIYVKKQDPSIRQSWVMLFNTLEKEHGFEMALLASNKWLLRQKERKEVLARTMKYAKVKFELQKDKELIARTINGQDYVEFMLTDVFANEMGETHSPEVLEQWAKEINENPIVGDIDHEEYDKMLEAGLSDEQIVDAFKSKKGIAKTVKAMVNKGQLWVRAQIDKRYKNVINKSKGVSLEAYVRKDDNKVIGGNVLGFTFAVDQAPVNNRTRIEMK